MIVEFKGTLPSVDESAFVAETAVLTGKVSVGKNANIWYGAVLRGDMSDIVIGEDSNVQDNAVVHTGIKTPAIIGKGVTVGHGAIIHGASIGDNTLVGMGSIVLDGAKIGKNCIIGAGAVVTGGTEIPDGSLVLGTPAKVAKELSLPQIASNKINAAAYVKLGKEYKKAAEK